MTPRTFRACPQTHDVWYQIELGVLLKPRPPAPCRVLICRYRMRWNSTRLARCAAGLGLVLFSGIDRVAVRATLATGALAVRAKSQGPRPAEVSRLMALAWRSPLPPPVGNFTMTFSYSGPARGVHVEREAGAGKKLYVDADALMPALPEALRDADYVEASDADRLYNTADLMELAVNADTVVSVAHDSRLPRPGWLGAQFKPTDLVLTVGGKPMQVFQHVAAGEESLVLGGNAEPGGAGVRDCHMYLVFVSPAGSH